MTLDQRRRRLLFGMAFFAVVIAGFVGAALAGVERHLTLFSSWPIWPTVGIFVVQWIQVRAEIRKHGPDQLEQAAPVSRKVLAAALCGLAISAAIGVVFLWRVPA